jgi:uncharacterized protein (TIGR00369 family)
MDEKTARDSFERALAAHEPKFEKFFLSGLIGLEFSYTHDSCTIEFEVADFMFNPQGSLHGGIIATVMDISMGHLIHHRTGRGAATIEMKTQYLRPLVSGRARCVSGFIRFGRRISYLESRLYDADGKLSAASTATWLMPGD